MAKTINKTGLDVISRLIKGKTVLAIDIEAENFSIQFDDGTSIQIWEGPYGGYGYKYGRTRNEQMDQTMKE